jgi:hypothetical protein
MPIDSEFQKYLVTLGVGGVLAAFMFVFYRKDVKQYTDLWKTTTEMLVAVIKEGTASNIKLIALIENLERNVLRKSDIEFMIEKRINENNIKGK